jgi:hypothetical protein
MKKLLVLLAAGSALASCADDHHDMDTTEVYVIEQEEYVETQSNGFKDMSDEAKQEAQHEAEVKANESKQYSGPKLQKQLEIVRSRNPYLFKEAGGY